MSVISNEKVNILLVDDQPAKLLSYEAILGELGENLITATSAREALSWLLKLDIGLILIDVCMPELDGFELASMIREHPRFQKTPLIFVSAVQLTDLDRLRGYEAGAVDYVPVPVVPEVLRAKVRVFVELHRKTRQLERLNAELENRVAERTAELEASAARLKESEQRRTLALAAGAMGSWEWDVDTDTYLWDDSQYRIFGLDRGEGPATFDMFRNIIHPDDLARMTAAAAATAADGVPFNSQFRIIHPNGDVRWCISVGAATADGSGRYIRVSGVTHDITERKRAEEELLNINERLENLVEARTREREIALAQLFEAQKIDTIGQLTGGVAHDFNNLLMAILGSLELLKKRLPNEPRLLRLLDNALQGAERGAALTQRLLAFARRQELKPQSVQAPRLIRGMRDLLERALGPGIEMTIDIADDLSPIIADANQLELAILNLVVNARDAMPNGGGISIAAREESHEAAALAGAQLAPGDYVCIEVTDSGQGMDEATLARAREPFFTTKGPGKGTGLGLSMVHGLAAQSGGALLVTSEVDVGTAVKLYLPRAETHLEPVEADREQTLVAAAGAPAAQTTIVLVDDDALVRTGTAAMIEDLGFNVIECESGAEAIDVIAAHIDKIDVVITDHAMPGMSGLELIRHLKATYPALPLILASGFAEIPDQADAASVPRLAKPFRQTQVFSAITEAAHLGRHSPAAVAAEQ